MIRSLPLLTAGVLQWDLDSPCGDDGPADGVTPEQWARAKELAVEWVWALSGRRFGLVDVAYRPAWTTPPQPACYAPVGLFMSGPYGSAPWRGRPRSNIATLPGPVDSVTEVLINGDVVASGAYITQGNKLIRADGETWPAYQNTADPLTEDGTWQISYVRGLAVPDGGRFAAGVLACEIAKALCGEGKCRLPANVQTVVRNGTTVNLDASQLQKGYTTLREVDQWCRMVNPRGIAQAPTVWSPDLDPNLMPPVPTSASA